MTIHSAEGDPADGAAALVQSSAEPVRLNTQERFAFTEGAVWDGAGSLHFKRRPQQHQPAPRARRHLRCPPVRNAWRQRHGPGPRRQPAGVRGCRQQGESGHLDSLAVETVVERYGGKPLNSPNDLVLDRAGGFYFTDPVFPAAGQRPVQDVGATTWGLDRALALGLI